MILLICPGSVETIDAFLVAGFAQEEIVLLSQKVAGHGLRESNILQIHD